MARINIEEEWWSDPRRQKLTRLLQGDSRLADGLMIQAWRLSQKYDNQQFLIPLSQFLCIEDAHLLFECFLAELRVKGASEGQKLLADPKRALEGLDSGLDLDSKYLVYIKGSEALLAWVTNQRLSGSKGGKVSAQRPRDSKGRLLPKSQAGSKQALDVGPSETKDVQTSSSNSSSSSSSSSNSGSGSKKNNAGIRTDYPHDFDEAWAAYERKGDKKKAYEVWCSLKLSTEEKGSLMNAIKISLSNQPERVFRKDFERFLQTDWREHLVTGVLKQTRPRTQSEQIRDDGLAMLKRYREKIEREEREGIITSGSGLFSEDH